MKRFNVTVNGKTYDVLVEETDPNAPAAEDAQPPAETTDTQELPDNQDTQDAEDESTQTDCETEDEE